MGALLAAGVPYEALRHHTPEQVEAILDGITRVNAERAKAEARAVAEGA